MTSIHDELAAAIQADEPVVLATLVSGEPAGARLLIYEGGRRSGTLGHAGLDDEVPEDALAMLPDGKTETRTYQLPDGSQVDVYIESYQPPRRLVIVGAVHTAIPLERIAREDLGYETVVIDAREFFATRERFPDAGDLVVAWPDEALAKLALGPQTDIVMLAHDPKFEDPAMEVALRSRAGYIGAMGSKKTSAERNQRLLAAGFTEAQVGRIHGPVGIDLGARSPGEIAVSIIAEIIAVRHGRDPRGVRADLKPARADAGGA